MEMGVSGPCRGHHQLGFGNGLRNGVFIGVVPNSLNEIFHSPAHGSTPREATKVERKPYESKTKGLQMP